MPRDTAPAEGGPGPSFAGKRALISGAASGIGRRVAERLQAAGARVTGLDRLADAPGLTFPLVQADLRDPEQVATVCDRLKAEDERLDILVNAAGVLRTGPAEQLSEEDWQACMEVNAGAPFRLIAQWIPVFKAQRGGAIVTVASNAAHVPRAGMTAYCASKAAAASLTRCIGLELAPYGVRCNIVSPGSTDTPMLSTMMGGAKNYPRLVAGLPEQFKLGIPLGKVASTEDIAEAVLYLVSAQAGHVTLQDIVVDGGATLGA